MLELIKKPNLIMTSVPTEENFRFFEANEPGYDYELNENGVRIKDVSVKSDGRTIVAETEEACKQLGKYKSDDFPAKNLRLNLNNLEEFDCFSISAMVTRKVDKEEAIFISEIRDGVILTLNVNLFKWEYSFSFDIYKELFLRNVNNNDFKRSDYGILYGLPFIHFEINSNLPNNVGIKDYVDEYISKIKDTHQQTIAQIAKTLQNDTFLTLFNFPDEIKVSCEQYLLYFAQFLQDLGIIATSNLKEEAGKVLFSVTPTGDVEALDKIREALAVYLNLPASPIVYDESFAAMRLQQQIENLQHSQKLAVREVRLSERELLLAQTVIEQQDNLLRQKDSIIEQKNKIIEKIESKSIMMDSLENKEELEEIYDGLKIGESKFLKEQLGIHLNPAKVIKAAVKNTLGKDEKKSVLGLDED